MKLEGLEKALREGCKLHGFRSGGGLRVIRLEKDDELRGYGEHPNVEDALSHANDNFLAGGKKYSEVYGKSKPHYLTGSRQSISSLDDWLLQGKDIDAHMQGGEIVVELRGLTQTEIPKDVKERIDNTRQPVTWKHRGYTFETKPNQFPNGEPCYSTSLFESPEGENKADPWMYDTIRVGKAGDFFEAVGMAFEAEEVEVSK